MSERKQIICIYKYTQRIQKASKYSTKSSLSTVFFSSTSLLVLSFNNGTSSNYIMFLIWKTSASFYDPSTKRQTPERKYQEERWPLKVRTSKVKTMLIALFDSQGILFTLICTSRSNSHWSFLQRSIWTFLQPNASNG